MTLEAYLRSTLTKLVRIPSSEEAGPDRILKAAGDVMERLGLTPRVHRDVAAITASKGRGGVLLNGHLDTVPVGSGWTRKQATWEGDLLYGRGTADMKAGCAAALAAARLLIDRRVPFSLLLTTDEETSMDGAKRLASSSLVRDAAAIVVAEPTDLKVIASEKGILWYRATVLGRSAHGSAPHLGDNAVYRMARVLPRLEPLGNPSDPLSQVTVNLGRIRGGSAPNVVADACTVDLDVRYPPTMDRSGAEGAVRDALSLSGEDVTLDLFHEVPAVGVPPDAPHIRLLRDLAGSDAVGVTYATEMAWFAQHNARCAVFGPGDPQRIHGPDEHVSLADAVRAAGIMAEFATRTSPAKASR